jgi:hypothetical protein
VPACKETFLYYSVSYGFIGIKGAVPLKSELPIYLKDRVTFSTILHAELNILPL